MEPMEPAQAEPVKRRRGQTSGVGRGRGERINAVWTGKEEDHLVALYNDWLEQERGDGRLPFAFTPPPRADVSKDDGLAFDFSAPLTSSLSPFAASFHSLLPLMWLDIQREPPPLPAPPPVLEETTTTGVSDEILQARREFVLHEKPLPKEAQLHVQQLFAPSPMPLASLAAAVATQKEQDEEEDNASVESREEREKVEEGKEGEGAEASDSKGFGRPRRGLQFFASSALLRPFYDFAAERIGRSSGQVQHHLDIHRNRLSLPVGIPPPSAASRSSPLPSPPLTWRPTLC